MPETDDPKDTVDAGTADSTTLPHSEGRQTAETVVVQRRSGLPAVLGGVVAAALGFGAAQFVPGIWPAQPNESLVADVASLRAELTALQGAVAEIPKPDLTLADRISALEGAPVPSVPDLKPLEERVATLEAQPATSGTQTSGGVNVATSVLSAQAKDIAALQADVAALKTGGVTSPDIDAKLAEAEVRVAALIAQAEAGSQLAQQQNALMRLGIALETGGPFVTALDDLAPAEIPTVLAENAAGGLPSALALQAGFPDAARAALEASLRVSAGESWTDRAASFLRNQTGARSLTPREGNDPDAVLSRAEAALEQGNVAGTLAEIAALPAEGQAALSSWIAQANTYLAAQQAVADLRAALNVE